MADIYNFITSIVSWIWFYKVQILGGLFISLAIFEYFYKKYLAKKRKQQIKQIKNAFSNLQRIIIVMSELNSDQFKDIDNIREHEQIKTAVEGLRIQMSSGFEVVELNLKTLERKTDDILLQAKTTNGRVTELEKGMTFINWLRRNKWYIGITLIAFMKVYESIPFKSFFDFAVRLLTRWI